jgi:RNA polymerase sigma-70 factor, ECF subfamily
MRGTADGRRPRRFSERTESMDEQRILLLVRRAQGGDTQAFGELAAHFEPTVFATVLRRLRNRSEALEVTQDVFVQALRKLGQLREPERFAGWLRQIAVRMAINRAGRRPQETLRNPATFGTLSSAPGGPLDDLLRNEQAQAVWGGLERLRELDRRTLIAFYFEGRSLKEMSDQFDSPIGTIKRRLHTARNRLRDELNQMQPA